MRNGMLASMAGAALSISLGRELHVSNEKTRYYAIERKPLKNKWKCKKGLKKYKGSKAAKKASRGHR